MKMKNRIFVANGLPFQRVLKNAAVVMIMSPLHALIDLQLDVELMLMFAYYDRYLLML